MEPVLERMRLLHQSIEENRAGNVEDLLSVPTTVKEKILQDHRLKMRQDAQLHDAQTLIELYEDADGSRKAALDAISGDTVYTVFYDRLKAVREYYRKYPEAPKIPKEELKPKVAFTGDENSGKHVDLNLFHERFVNMPAVFERCNYITYLSKFEKLFNVPRATKMNAANLSTYRSYIDDLLAYLIDFFTRIHPLVDVDKLKQMIKEDFDKRWEMKAITGWFEKEDEASSASAAAPESDPLYCKACQKSFAKESVFQAHLTGKKHLKAIEASNSNSAAAASPNGHTNTNSPKQIAETEEYIFRFAELLRSQINETIGHIEKKQTRTYEEIEKELEDADETYGKVAEVISSDSEDEEKPIYNPLNLPLGWDGKPIPFWLYKLHGLNIEQKCEICGGYGYWGPRAWERHFTEWRHTYGMRCLGIPNTKEFRNITTFEDAMAVFQKVQDRKKSAEWVPEEGEEFEDREGNVFNKKTYEDLKRQGII